MAMLAPNGNMAEVYAEFWRMQEIADQVEPQINEVARLMAAMEAEIGDDEARWILVQAYPGDDLKALRNLARRRFGVFRATQRKTPKRNETNDEISNRANVSVMEPIFAGWLFVFVWNIRKMKHRILACPGVMGILCRPDTQEPVSIEDRFVQKLRGTSFAHYAEPEALPSHAEVEAQRHITRQKKPRKRKGKRIKVRGKRGQLPQPALTESATGVTEPCPAVAGSPSGCG